MRRRTTASLVAGLAVALTAVSLPAAALETSAAGEATVTWDGTSGQVVQLQNELFGSMTVIPGTTSERVVSVTNNGPADGVLTVAIVNVTALPVDDRGDDTFFEDLLINGIPAADLEGGETQLASVALAQGATTETPLVVAFPVEATSGNAAQVGEREFAFDVRLTLTGETPTPTPTPTPATPTPTPTPAPTAPAGSGTDNGTGTGPVASTGGALDGVDSRLIAAAAALAAVAALAGRPLVAAYRRGTTESGQ